MINLIKTLTKIEKEIVKEKGYFNLYGLFLREDANDKWDFVVSASWAIKDKRKFLEYLIQKISKNLDKKALVKFSKVVVLDSSHPFVFTVNKIIRTEHNSVEFTNCYFDNVPIKHAFIITSKKSKAS